MVAWLVVCMVPVIRGKEIGSCRKIVWICNLFDYKSYSLREGMTGSANDMETLALKLVIELQKPYLCVLIRCTYNSMSAFYVYTKSFLAKFSDFTCWFWKYDLKICWKYDFFIFFQCWKYFLLEFVGDICAWIRCVPVQEHWWMSRRHIMSRSICDFISIWSTWMQWTHLRLNTCHAKSDTNRTNLYTVQRPYISTASTDRSVERRTRGRLTEYSKIVQIFHFDKSRIAAIACIFGTRCG